MLFISNIKPIDRLCAINSFIKKHLSYWKPRHLADFPEPLRSIPADWVAYIKSMPLKDKFLISQFKSENKELPGSMPATFRSFILEMQDLTNIDRYEGHEEESVFDDPIYGQQINRLELKKCHEIRNLMPLIKSVQSNQNLDMMIDVGGGKSFLSLAASGLFPKQVVIDFNESLLRKCESYYKRWHRETKLSCHCMNVQDEGYIKSISEKLDFSLLTGLHLCGNLTNNLIKSFVSSEARSLVSLGCCFHRLEERDQNLSGLCEFTLSASEFRLALVPYHYRSFETFLNNDIKNHYRFAMYAIYYKLTGEHPNKAYMNEFDYPHRADQLNFSEFLIKNEEVVALGMSHLELISIYETYAKEMAEEMEVYEFVRRCMSRVTECYLVLDRLVYLEQAGIDVRLFQIFDGRISPRNLVILANKN